MKKSPLPWMLMLLAALLITGCAAAAPQVRELVAAEPGFAPETGVAVFDEAEPMLAEAPAEMEEQARFAGEALAQDRIVIRNANLALVVSDPAESVDEIGRMAEEMGGFVVASNVFQSTFGTGNIVADQASITIRVPSERLDEALDRIKDEATEVRSENVSGQDVTQEFTDLQSRLTNLEAAEEQLREIMASATKTEDVLRVFDDLRRVREEIEVTKGRIQFLDQSAKLSAISVDLIPDVAAQPIQIGGWSPTGTAKNAIEALIRTLQVLANAGIWIALYVLPVLIVLSAVPIAVAAWIIRRRRRSKEEASSAQEK